MSQGSDPVINSNGSFTFPAWFAHRLLSCYYGNGPKADGASPSNFQQPATESSNAPPVPQPSSLEGEFAHGVAVNLSGPPAGYVPRGFGVPRTPPKIPTPHDPLKPTISTVGGGVTSNGH